jgi:hypothetical protein
MAATPPGDHLLGGIYLVRPGPGLVSLCARQSRVSGFAVPCPTLIPGTSTDVYCPAGAICAERGAFVLEGTFRGPPDYHGVERGSGHLWIIAFGPQSGVWPGSTLLGGHQVGQTRVRGQPAMIVQFPPGSALNSGHEAIIWHRAAMTFAVTLHGHTRLNERLDLVIANHLRFIETR